ncbi:hypothetical protein [Natronobeatus ordinarius]|nr:hypothetical protein [Natronobeatus ordinarius]
MGLIGRDVEGLIAWGSPTSDDGPRGVETRAKTWVGVTRRRR